MKDRELVMKVVTDELKARNIPYKIEHGRKHAKIRFTFGGIPRVMVSQHSNKAQGRLIHNVRANMRRILLNRVPATGTSGR